MIDEPHTPTNEPTANTQPLAADRQPRYYLRTGEDEHGPIGCVDLIERGAIDNGDGPEDMTLASFYDGDDRESALGSFVRDLLNTGAAIADGIPSQPVQPTTQLVAPHAPYLAYEELGHGGKRFEIDPLIPGRLSTGTEPYGNFPKVAATGEGYLAKAMREEGEKLLERYAQMEPVTYQGQQMGKSGASLSSSAILQAAQQRFTQAMREAAAEAIEKASHMEPITLYGGGIAAGKSAARHDWLVTHGYLPVDSQSGDENDLLDPSPGVGFDEEDDEEWDDEDEDEELDEAGEPPPFAVPVSLDYRTCQHDFEEMPRSSAVVWHCKHCDVGYLEVKQPSHFMHSAILLGSDATQITPSGDEAIAHVDAETMARLSQSILDEPKHRPLILKDEEPDEYTLHIERNLAQYRAYRAAGKPYGAGEAAFMRWVVDHGEQFASLPPPLPDAPFWPDAVKEKAIQLSVEQARWNKRATEPETPQPSDEEVIRRYYAGLNESIRTAAPFTHDTYDTLKMPDEGTRKQEAVDRQKRLLAEQRALRIYDGNPLPPVGPLPWDRYLRDDERNGG